MISGSAACQSPMQAPSRRVALLPAAAAHRVAARRPQAPHRRAPPPPRAADDDAAPAVPSPPISSPRDDDVLPDSLTDALAQAAAATAAAIGGGARRATVELQLPEFWDAASGAVFAEAGDQARFWKLTRRFAEELGTALGPGSRVRALYPDAGTAAMLAAQWGDATFSVGAVSDRTPFSPDDDAVLLAAPDPPSLAAAVRVADLAAGGDGGIGAAAVPAEQGAAEAAASLGPPVVMFNPRLVSGDVGIGLNVRRLRDAFLGSFVLAYALRPVGDVGTVFRRYPDRWKVFVADPSSPGRYTLAAEQDKAPAGDALDLILMNALGSGVGGGVGGGGAPSGSGPAIDPSGDALPSLLDQVAGVVRGLQRFMRQLTR